MPHSLNGSGGFFLSGDIVQPLVTGEQSDGHSALSRITVLPGNGQILHRHAQHETLYVLSGEVQFSGARGGVIRNYAGGPGTLLHFPGCVPHNYYNASSEPATLLSFTTPAGLEAYYARAGQQVQCLSDALSLHADRERIESVGWEYGIEPVDPELYDAREGYRASGAHFVSPTKGAGYRILHSMIRILADAHQTEGWLTVLEITQRGSATTQPYRHGWGGTYYTLEGSFEFTLGSNGDSRRATVPAGKSLQRAPGTTMAYRNLATGNSRMLAFLTPAGIEDFIRAIGTELKSTAEFLEGEWDEPSAEELARVAALSSQLGVEIL